MSPPPDKKLGQKGLEALSQLVRESVSPPTPVRLARGLQGLNQRITGEQTRRKIHWRWALLGATVAGLAVVIVGASALRKAPSPSQLSALTYTIANGSLIEGGYLRETGKVGVKLSFNEGTEFVLRPGTRGRLRSIEPTGARIAIEQGTASFQVTPGSGRLWQVDVGPFLVTVKGTIFTVSWDASNERFELNLQRGTVLVRGPVLGGDITLKGGQRLVADLPAARTIISEQGTEITPTPSAAVSLPEIAPAPFEQSSARSPASVSRSSSGRPGGARRWQLALANGQWDQILADAERAGLQKTLATASSEDLITLANAARYRRKMGVARQALLAERRRFPGSVRSLDAVFLLGRVEEATTQGLDRAIAWYDEYLTRAPSGLYASESLGRKLILTERRRGEAQARPLAEEYLRRFPNGSYAGTARALCSPE